MIDSKEGLVVAYLPKNGAIRLADDLNHEPEAEPAPLPTPGYGGSDR